MSSQGEIKEEALSEITGPRVKSKKRISPFTPSRRFASESIQKKVALLASILCLIFCVIMQYLTVASVKKEDRVFLIDGTKTISIGPTHALSINSPIFQKTAILATQTIFQRSPVPGGFDLPEFIPFMFRDKAAKKLSEDYEEQRVDIEARNLHQKPEIEYIEALRESDGVRILQVRGTLKRSGVFKGVPIAESEDFKLMLSIVMNPNLADRDRYPFIIYDFKIN